MVIFSHKKFNAAHGKSVEFSPVAETSGKVSVW